MQKLLSGYYPGSSFCVCIGLPCLWSAIKWFLTPYIATGIFHFGTQNLPFGTEISKSYVIAFPDTIDSKLLLQEDVRKPLERFSEMTCSFRGSFCLIPIRISLDPKACQFIIFSELLPSLFNIYNSGYSCYPCKCPIIF